MSRSDHSQQAEKHIGESDTMHCGKKITITRYRSYTDITGVFDGGTEVETTMRSFRNKSVTHPGIRPQSAEYRKAMAEQQFNEYAAYMEKRRKEMNTELRKAKKSGVPDDELNELMIRQLNEIREMKEHLDELDKACDN